MSSKPLVIIVIAVIFATMKIVHGLLSESIIGEVILNLGELILNGGILVLAAIFLYKIIYKPKNKA